MLNPIAMCHRFPSRADLLWVRSCQHYCTSVDAENQATCGDGQVLKADETCNLSADSDSDLCSSTDRCCATPFVPGSIAQAANVPTTTAGYVWAYGEYTDAACTQPTEDIATAYTGAAGSCVPAVHGSSQIGFYGYCPAGGSGLGAFEYRMESCTSTTSEGGASAAWHCSHAQLPVLPWLSRHHSGSRPLPAALPRRPYASTCAPEQWLRRQQPVVPRSMVTVLCNVHV